MTIVSTNIISPAGISAGNPTAKTLRLGAARETIPSEVLTSSRPKIIGNESLVRELAFTARNMGSEEAASCGLVSYVGKDREDLMRHALNTAKVISGHSPVGITSTKVNILYSRDHSVDDGLDFVLAWNAFALQTEDVKKAVVAGMTKKKAKFSKL